MPDPHSQCIADEVRELCAGFPVPGHARYANDGTDDALSVVI